MPKPKNVLILLLDSLNFASVVGRQKSASTVAIDWLCSQGALFTRHHSVTSFTVPAVASMLTGVYPLHHKLHFQADTDLAPGITPLGAFFKQAGYRTLATVTEVLNDQGLLLAGFDEITRRPNAEQGIHTGWGVEVARRIRTLNLEQEPWLYLVHSFDLHPQRQCAPQYRSKAWGRNYYDQTLSSLDAHLAGILAQVNLEETLVVMLGDHGENTLFEPSSSESLAHNAYSLRIGSKLEPLREWCFQLGLRSRSKFLMRNNPLMHHDYHLYNFLTHVPMVIVSRGFIAPGSTCSKLTGHIDLLPTLLDLAGVNPGRAHFDGRSLLPVFAGDPDWAERPVFQELYSTFIWRSRPMEQILNQPLFLGVVTPEWHMILCPTYPGLAPELYNLNRDPDERKNVARAHPDTIRRLRKQLDAMLWGEANARIGVDSGSWS
ncbi:sulfatase family protein [Anthocerotibacter panamensis]|uniref:sulfatase family protein n=1 Tax=Anthocerotibacter panamensis TaxID=2857077 RepID=UPI001C4018A1|nr:sulfatase-like hydrolase/transferase [Anthocerotibacter panamensis]